MAEETSGTICSVKLLPDPMTRMVVVPLKLSGTRKAAVGPARGSAYYALSVRAR